jgi:hypothetical protein
MAVLCHCCYTQFVPTDNSIGQVARTSLCIGEWWRPGERKQQSQLPHSHEYHRYGGVIGGAAGPVAGRTQGGSSCHRVNAHACAPAGAPTSNIDIPSNDPAKTVEPAVQGPAPALQMGNSLHDRRQP